MRRSDQGVAERGRFADQKQISPFAYSIKVKLYIPKFKLQILNSKCPTPKLKFQVLKSKL
jgi:hypothetical protein